MHSCPADDEHSYTPAGLSLEPISDLTRARKGPLPSWCILLLEKQVSLANDLVEDRSVVITRAVFSMRFVENKLKIY